MTQLRERIRQLESSLFVPKSSNPSALTSASSFDATWGESSGSGTLALGQDGSMAFYGRSASPDVRRLYHDICFMI